MLNSLRQKITPSLRAAAFYGLYCGAIGTFGPFLYVFFQRKGLTSQEIGILAMTLPVSTLVISPLISRFADRKKLRVQILAGLAFLFALGLIVLRFPNTFVQVLACLLIANIMRGPIEPISNSIIVRMSSRFQFNFGRVRIAGSIGYTLAAIGLGALWQTVGFEWMFYTASAITLGFSVAALLLEDTTPPQLSKEKQPGVSLIFKDWVLLVILATSFMVGAAMSLYYTFNSIYADEIHVGELAIGAIMGFAAIGEIPTMEFGSRLVKRLGDFNALLLSYLLLGIGIFIYGFFDQAWGLILASTIRGLGYGLFFISTVVVIDRRAPFYLSSTYQSVSSSVAWGLAPLLVGLVSGTLYEKFGAQNYFVFAGVIIFIAAGLLVPAYIYSRKKGDQIVR